MTGFWIGVVLCIGAAILVYYFRDPIKAEEQKIIDKEKKIVAKVKDKVSKL